MALDCVGLAWSSVIRIIHRNVGLKCFFHLPKCLLLSLVISYIYILQGNVKHIYDVVEYMIITL